MNVLGNFGPALEIFPILGIRFTARVIQGAVPAATERSKFNDHIVSRCDRLRRLNGKEVGKSVNLHIGILLGHLFGNTVHKRQKDIRFGSELGFLGLTLITLAVIVIIILRDRNDLTCGIVRQLFHDTS